MSDIVKWGILAGVIVLAVGVIIGTGAWGAIVGLFANSEIGVVISKGVDILSSSLILGRQSLNNFFYPPVLSSAIIMSFGMFSVYMAVRVVTFVTRFIYK